MKLPAGEWLVFNEVDSTQSIVASKLLAGEKPGIVLARHQTAGKGRFGRTWVSEPGHSLAASIVFDNYVGHRHPWLIGMSVAAAAAGALHCQLRWPNDLSLGGRKLGGILTELVPDGDGASVPVVGIGINLGPIQFPSELQERATTLSAHRSQVPTPEQLLAQILERVAGMPEPLSWQDVEPVWSLFDETPGKRYRLAGGQEAVALSVGPEGELLASVDGESTTIMAADAIFGSDPAHEKGRP